MPTGPDFPRLSQIERIAKDWGFELDAEEMQTFRSLVGGTVKAARHVELLPEIRPVVKYPRDAGWRPAPADNPYNGWAWRCDIRGAEEGLLEGLRVAVKDVVSIAGLPLTNGSRILEGFVSDTDSTIITRMLDAGATIVGKTNCEDFCFSGGGHTCSLGPVQNPYDPTRNPGASSNGSAVVLATGQADVAIGGDQGGSIRLPASWSGVYGLKPTHGLVPYTGCAMIEATLDHIGPMANDTEGLARLLQVIAGQDPLDPRQRGVIPDGHSTDYLAQLSKGVKGMKIAVVREGFDQDGSDTGFPPSDPNVDRRVKAAVKLFEKLGATVEEISLPQHLDGYFLWSLIITLGSGDFMLRGAGLGSNWKGWYNTTLGEAVARGIRARPNDLPETAKMAVFASEYMKHEYLGRYYGKAQNLRHIVVDAYDAAFAKYDMLAMPTTPFTATKLSDRDAPADERVSSALNMLRNTCVANLTGHPSISIPCGLEDGLPFGMMLTAGHLREDTLLRASAAFETLGDWKSL